MKKVKLIFCAILMVFLCGGAFSNVFAWEFVSSYTSTGWEDFSYTFANGFNGTVGFVVSNEGDQSVNPYLLLDNLSTGTNSGFETGDLTGYTLSGSGSTSTGINFSTGYETSAYSPTQGGYMAALTPAGSSTSTSAFSNYYGTYGTNGSILEASISVLAGQAFSFDWAFLSYDYWSFKDFSLVYFKDVTGAIVYSEGLGQLSDKPYSPVPEPATMLLFGSALMGLLGLGRKKLGR